MQAKDSNTRSISSFVGLLARDGLDVSGICDGLPVSLDEILQPDTWLDWPTAATIMDRVGELAGGQQDVVDLTRRAALEMTDQSYSRLFKLVVNPAQMYRMVAKVIAPAICPYHRAHFEKIDEERVRVELQLPDSGPDCPTFFYAAEGLFRGLPKVLAMNEAEVEATYHPYRAEFEIRFPASLTLWSRTRRLFAPRGRIAAIDELDAQQQRLSANNRELQRAYDEIKEREKTLKAEIAERTRIQEALALQEEQLRQAQKMEAMGKLSGGIAHDFNNHLTVIMLYAEAILETEDTDSAHTYAARIRDAATTSASLTKQLLAFARKQVLQPKVLDLNELISKSDDMLRRTLGETIQLDFVRGGGLGKARVDPAQLEQALVNLAINSRDAIGERSGHLTVETANVFLNREYTTAHGNVEPGRFVMLAVSDDGPGISPAEMKLVFEPFYTTKETGTGLGLSMVQGFVAQSGGLINVYSEQGVGTSFKIYLPRVDREAETESWGEESTAGAVMGSESILVVEDEAILSDLVTDMLTRHGYDVTAARDGFEAVQKAAGKTLDLVLTDVVMPGMNGPEVVERIRETHPGLQAVYMSGYTENAIAHRGELDPGVILIEKPFTTRELLGVVRRTLGGS